MSKSSRTRAAKGLCCSCKELAVRGGKCQKHWEEAKQRAANKYKASVMAGLCGMCKTQPIDPNSKSLCINCQAEQREKRKNKKQEKAHKAKLEREALVAQGICSKCFKGKAINGHKVCEICLTILSIPDQNNVTHYAKRRALGICVSCKNKIDGVNARCQDCLDKRKAKHKDIKLSGLCPGCKSVTNNDIYCDNCKDKQRKRYAKLKFEGICTKCGKVPAVKVGMCDHCYLKSLKGNTDKYARLRKAMLAAYGGKCKHCGESNEAVLEVDHVGNDGNVHRKELVKLWKYWSSTRFFYWLKKNNYPQDRFQLLCANCHTIKHKTKKKQTN
jgi:hypothetical protein